MANRNWSNGGKLWMMEVMPVELTCNFIVDSTNGNGLGIRSLKGAGIQAVYMATSATKAVGSPGGSTGPANGTIVVQFQNSFNKLLGGTYSLVSPAGSNLKVDASDAALTAGVAYVITILGDATAADWLALGVPAGVTPAVGVAFIASVTGSGTASVTRVAPTAANGTEVLQIETVGDSNQAIAPNPTKNQGFGAQIILQCRNSSSANHSASVTPANNSVIQLTFQLSNSSVTSGQGE
jgi:hypothetical protein